MTANLALALISAAVLAYEVLLVRLFAIVQWHHFAFMAISIALLGFGASGSVIAVAQAWLRRHVTAGFAAAAALFAITAPLAFLAAQAIPFNARAVVWNPWELAALPAMVLVLVVPFFFGAGYIGLAFLHHGERMGRIYAINLLGSGAGALGIVAALFVLAPADGLRLVAGLGFAAALLVLAADRRALPATLAGLGILACLALPESWLALRISPYKGLPTALSVSGAALLDERSSPLGLLSVVESPTVPFRSVPGLSLAAPALPPEQLGVFIDGDSMTAIDRGEGGRDYLGYTTDAAAYHVLDEPAVLVLGAGGGRNVSQAILHAAVHIDAVELDANMARLVREHASSLYDRPDVALHIAEARGFVAASESQWDLIQIPLLDAIAGSGMHGLNESHLYTVEAFETYLAHLRPDGWLSITRWLRLPPRDSLRLFTTALAAIDHPDAAERLVLLRGMTTTTLLVKRDAVSEADMARLRAFAEARSFDIAYAPGLAQEAANRFNVLDAAHFFEATQALAGEGAEDFIARYKFDVSPTTDERPYFFDFLKWHTLPELLRLPGAGLLDLGKVILVATLLQAIALSALLILLPLRLRRIALHLPWRVGGYFTCLGLAYLFIEIAVIQKLVLFLSHPVYAVAAALTGFLVFSGLGSAVSSRFAIPLAIAAIAVLSLSYLWLLPGIFAALATFSTIAKFATAIALIAPLAFFMGMPFPLGLARLRQATPALVPWAWGVNGCASVLSAMLATLIAMRFGFSAVVATAAALYVSAAALDRHWAAR